MVHCENHDPSYIAKPVKAYNSPQLVLSPGSPLSCADVIYEAAADGTNQLRYTAGEGAESTSISTFDEYWRSFV